MIIDDEIDGLERQNKDDFLDHMIGIRIQDQFSEIVLEVDINKLLNFTLLEGDYIEKFLNYSAPIGVIAEGLQILFNAVTDLVKLLILTNFNHSLSNIVPENIETDLHEVWNECLQ